VYLVGHDRVGLLVLVVVAVHPVVYVDVNLIEHQPPAYRGVASMK